MMLAERADAVVQPIEGQEVDLGAMDQVGSQGGGAAAAQGGGGSAAAEAAPAAPAAPAPPPNSDLQAK